MESARFLRPVCRRQSRPASCPKRRIPPARASVPRRFSRKWLRRPQPEPPRPAEAAAAPTRIRRCAARRMARQALRGGTAAHPDSAVRISKTGAEHPQGSDRACPARDPRLRGPRTRPAARRARRCIPASPTPPPTWNRLLPSPMPTIFHTAGQRQQGEQRHGEAGRRGQKPGLRTGGVHPQTHETLGGKGQCVIQQPAPPHRRQQAYSAAAQAPSTSRWAMEQGRHRARARLSKIQGSVYHKARFRYNVLKKTMGVVSMINVENLTMQFAGSTLFSRVDLQSKPRQLLRHHRRQRRGKVHLHQDSSGELEPTEGHIYIDASALTPSRWKQTSSCTTPIP